MRPLHALLISSLVLAPLAAHADDLAVDWSDASNGFGAWSLRKNATDLYTTSLPDYWNNGTNQRAWVDSVFPTTAHVPFWMKVSTLNFPGNETGGCDIQVGDIMAHGAEADRTNTSTTSVVWTSPVAQTVTVAASLWFPLQRGRTMEVSLLKNEVAVSTATLVGNGTYTRASSFDMASASGGAAALTTFVNAGDTLHLYLGSTNSNEGELMGVRMAVTQAVPEPATFAALGLGIAALARRRRARRV